MARAGAREALEQPSPETRSPARGGRTGAGKAKAATKRASTDKPAAAEAKPVKKAAPRADKVASAASKSKGKTAAAAPEAGPARAPARAKKAAKTKAPAKGAAKAHVTTTDSGTTSGFPAKTLQKLQRLLEEERETYLRQAQDLAAEAEALASEREPGDTQFDEESGEGDTLNVERERDLALSASARQAVEEIDRALARMAAGTYGVCERCGKKISVARLEALPYAALCIECKSREERRR